MGLLIPFPRKQVRPASKPALASPHPRLLAAAITIIKQEKPMQIARRIHAMPAVTMAAERAVRLRVATSTTDIDLALSPTQAQQLRRDLSELLDRMRREAAPLPRP